MKRRVREKGELPGALWHIFHPGDTNKIRDLLNKVLYNTPSRRTIKEGRVIIP